MNASNSDRLRSWLLIEGERAIIFKRTAFSLVELLVVVSIVGAIAGLLLPAVQAAREAGRRLTCQSNLRQLGLASQNFESIYHRFPSGGWGYQWQGYSDVNLTSGQPGSWTYSLLPLIEQSTLYMLGSYHGNSAERDALLHRRIGTVVPIYNCPSRRNGLFSFNPGCSSCARPIGIVTPLRATARSDYAVNAGSGAPDLSHLESWPLNFDGPVDLDVARHLTNSNSWPKPPADWSGISWLAQSVKISTILDGCSNVFLYGEKYIMRDGYYAGTDWGDNEPLFGGFNNDNHRSTHGIWPLMRDLESLPSIGSFGSAHFSGVNFAMADGSVRMIPYTTDGMVYRSLGNRSDGSSLEIGD